MKWSLTLGALGAAAALMAQMSPTVAASPAALTFAHQIGAGALPAAQTVQVQSQPAGASLTVAVSGSPFNAAWLVVSASTVRTPASLRVQVNPTGLAAGSYTGTITLSGAGPAPPTAIVTVTLQVSAPAPTLVVSPASLNFTYVTGDPVPDPSLTSPLVLSSNGSPLQATVTVQGAPWLKVTPTGNVSIAGLFSTLAVTVDPTGLTPKVYTGTLRIAAPAAANKNVNITVTLTVQAAPPAVSQTWPFGVIQGSPAATITLTGRNFFSNSTVAAAGFTPAATVTVTASAASAAETLLIPVYPAGASFLRFAVGSPLPAGAVATPYAQTLAAAGGAAPYAYSLSGGVLPPGLALSGATISGTPTAAGAYTFTLRLTDAAGAETWQTFRLTVYPPGATALRVTVAASPLPAGTAGAAYGPVTLAAAGGSGPPSWAATGLPAGLTLSASGTLSGTPASEGLTGPLSATLVSDSSLLVNVPAAMLANEGVLRMAVTTPAPGGGRSNDASFTVFGPAPQITAVVNSASFRQGTISPGEIITIFGLGLGPATLAFFDPGAPPIPASLPAAAPATSVTINGTPAPLIYASAAQTAVIVPYSISGTTASVVVTYGGLSSPAYAVAVAPANPGIFTVAASGQGQAAVLNYNAASGDYTVNGSANPAARGSTVVLYVTGAGAMSSSVSNQLIPPAPPVTPLQAPSVSIGGQTATVLAAQAPPGSVPGLLQLNVTVPSTVTPGVALPVVVAIGGVDSQPGVTMAVR